MTTSSHSLKELLVPGRQRVIMLCGLPGSGKTTYAKTLMEEGGYLKLSIDEAVYERYGRYNVDYHHLDYRRLETETYKELDSKLEDILNSGKSVLLDYGFLLKKQRDKYRKLATDKDAYVYLLYFKASREVLLKRLEARNLREDPNALHVDEDLLERLYARFEEPAGEGEIIIQQ